MQISVLGPVEVSVGDRRVPIGAGRPRALLALLALHEGSVVSTDRLVEGLWGEEPPASATKMVQLGVSQLRKSLADDGAAIITRGHGYELRLADGGLDARRFEQLIAAGMPREALALWRGAPLVDVAEEPFAVVEIRRLEELRLRALELAVDRDLEHGRHREVLAELETLVAEEPLRERFHAQRMLALYRCGRQAAALDAYRAARTALVEAIGVEPGPALRRLHEAILSQDPALELGTEAAGLPPELSTATPLVGREPQLEGLRERWRRARAGARTVALVTGPPGIGKTRLVAELAGELHRGGVSVLYAAAADEEAALTALAAATDARRPVLAALDDVDRAAGPVKAALRALADRPATAPALVVATARDAAGTGLPEAVDCLTLAPLGAEEVDAVARSYAAEGAAPPAERLLAASDGVPARLHPAAREWARGEVARGLATAADRAASERAGLRTAEDELAGRVVQLKAAERRAAPDGAIVVCPFKGLASFEGDDAEFFFGREQLVAEMVARLAGAPLLGIVGPSGSGKSSALRAGLLPALAEGVLPGSERWAITLLRPGEHPVRTLERAAGTTSSRRALLAVDQFEELFTACRDERERAAFVDALVARARDPYQPAHVLVAVRADYYGRCAAYPELWRRLGADQVTVGPMRRDELRRAIELPARRAGLRLDDGLADALVADVEGAPGALPLLSVSLLELWQQRDGRILRRPVYERAGGVHGAVARLAESAYERLDPDRRALARRLLLRLAGEGEGDAVVRRRVSLTELGADRDERVAEVLSVLAADRLVTIGSDEAEVAHEALLREWPRLRSWLEEDAEGRRLHRHLIHAARDWEAAGRDAGELYRGARLAAALDWSAEHAGDLTAPEPEFLAASRAAAEHDVERRRRAHRRLQGMLVALGGLLLLAGIAVAVAVTQGGEARDAARVADAQRLGAQALTDDHLEHALLLARAGVALDASPATRSNLLAVLQRSPAALGVLGVGAPLIAVALSPDQHLLALGDDDGKVTVLDAASRRPVGRPYVLRDGLVNSLVFSPDGRTLAVGGQEPKNEPPGSLLDLIDPRTGRRRLRVTLPRFPEPSLWVVVNTAFAPNGRDVLVQQTQNDVPNGPASVLRRVDGRTGALKGAPLRVGRFASEGVMPTGDARSVFVTSARDDETYRIDASSMRVLDRWPVGDLAGAVSSDGRRFALGSEGGGVRVLDLDTGRVRRFTGRHRASVNSMRFTPDGRTLITSGGEGQVIAWDVADGTIRETFSAHTGQVWGLATSGDGRTVYSGALDGRAVIWDLGGDRRLDRRFAAGRPFRARDGDQYPVGLAFGDRGRTLALTQSDGTLEFIDTATLRSQRRIRALGGFAAAVAYTPDGRRMAVAGKGGELRLLDAAGLRPEGPALRGLGYTSQAVAFSPDGRLLAAGQNEHGSTPGAVRVWDVRRRALTPARFGAGSASLAFSPNGRLLAAALVDHGVQVRDARSGKRVAAFTNGDFARSLAFSPDGSLLAVGLYDGKTELWETKGWKRVGQPLELHTGRVLSTAFSPDGRTLATSSEDGIVALWDVASHKPIGSAETVDGDAYVSAAFSPDGSHLFAVSANGRGVRWDVRPRSWARRACLIAGRELTPAEWRDVLPERPYRAICRPG